MRKETFSDGRFGGIERIIAPMNLLITAKNKQELDVMNIDPRIAWSLIDIFTEMGYDVLVTREERN